MEKTYRFPRRSTVQGTVTNYDNLIKVPMVELTQTSSSEFSLSLTLTNIMSIVPKIDELNLFVMSNQTDFVFERFR